MDVLAGFLDGPRARGAFVLKSVLDPPWSLRIEDEAPLTVVAVLRGGATLTFDDGEASCLAPGDVAIVRGPDHYTVGDDPSTLPTVIIHPGQRCETVRGPGFTGPVDLGVRTWGTRLDAATVMVTGTYQTDGQVSRRLLDTLPRLTLLVDGTWECPALDLLAGELAHDTPGQTVVLDRVLDLVLVSALRATYSRPGADVPAWYRAAGDPVVGAVIRLMHDDPAQPWTVAGLASTVGVSRACLARRFNKLVGEPPMSFLAGWRMALAADLLLDEQTTVSEVSRRVGYGSPFTFSTAFKRTHGLSPRNYRQCRLA